MRTIIHLSDLHFGRVDHTVRDAVVTTVISLKPDLVVVSGDLTQRARTAQFKEARQFLDALPQPQIVVPGNHDVPLYNVFSRFGRPLDKYRRYITDDMQPFYADDEIAVIGINTARSLTTKYGRINERQIAGVREKLCAYQGNVTKIVVTHHPFDLPDNHDEADLLGRSKLAMVALAECGADVLLAGHLHIGHTGHTAMRYRIAGHSALVVSAGTATSTRHRGEANSFNVVRINHPHIQVERLVWQTNANAFAPSSAENFKFSSDGWKPVPDEAAAGFVFAEDSDVITSAKADDET
ncbi:MAG TPA: metallophosphoesterase family protein [Pyrinomonadaceae bacterium]|jgi:3',5'-cyclic AMP phosphodiesterase CpdA